MQKTIVLFNHNKHRSRRQTKQPKNVKTFNKLLNENK